jgi:hypothetical protein
MKTGNLNQGVHVLAQPPPKWWSVPIHTSELLVFACPSDVQFKASRFLQKVRLSGIGCLGTTWISFV